MMKLARLLSPWLILAACQGAPQPQIQSQSQSQNQSQFQSWIDFVVQVKAMDAQQLLLARESAVRQYSAQPSDLNRLRAGYVLSRTPASPQQLVQSQEILVGISAASELAPIRDLLDQETRMFIQMQEAESRTLALRTQVDELQTRIVVLEAQLNALKSIETDMVKSQRQADETHP